MTTSAIPVTDKGLEFLRNAADRDLGALSLNIRTATNLCDLLTAVNDCVARLPKEPSEQCAAIYHHRHEIKTEIQRRSDAVGKS